MSGGVSNSSILIKRSSATARPSSLKSGELAYSYLSNTIFIGTSDGTSTLNIGGQYYTSQIDSATASNGANTIVKRDAAGNSYFGNVIVSGYITGQIQGIASAANSLYYPQNFGIAGGDISASNISFNGTNSVILMASLNTVPGLSSGTVGSATSIPVIQYGANGRILNVSSVTVSANYQPAFDWANSAYNQANSAYNRASAAFSEANSAYSLAGTAESDAQSAQSTATAAYSAACTAQQLAQSSYDSQNITATFANSAFTEANSAASFANGAFASANSVQFTITDGTHSNTFYKSGTLTVNSGQGVTAVASANALTFSTDNTVLRSNTTTGIGATQTISTALSVTGNLTTGNILPSSAYVAIGSFANPIQELYVASNSLNVGGISLSNTNTVLAVGGGVTDLTVGTAFGPLSNIASTANTGYNFVNTGGTVTGNVAIVGNLTVRGNTIQVDTTVATTTSGTIGLAANNTGDVIDIGLFGDYVTGGTNKLTGMIRSPGTSNYYLFNGINATELSGNTIPVADFTGTNSATLFANVVSYQLSSSGQATVQTLVANNAIGVGSGGTGQSTLPTGQIVLGNGTGAVQALANVSAINTSINPNYTVNNITTDVYGRITNYTTHSISGLTVSQGGTGQSTLPIGQIVIGNATGAVQALANVGTAGTYGNANTIAVTTTDVYGRVSGVTNTAIAITPSQITSTTGTGAVVLANGATLSGTTTAATLNVSTLNVTNLNVTYSNVNTVVANSINIGSLTYSATGAFVAFQANSNNYQQVVVQNSNQGTQASADFIVSNADSTDGFLYGDFGINGPNYSAGSGALSTANSVYLYAANAELAIGTSSANAIHFVVNGGSNDAATIASNGVFSLASALLTSYGGTGASTFTSDGIIYGNGGGALQATLAAGSSDQLYTNQVLTVTNAGVPVWASAVDGGTF